MPNVQRREADCDDGVDLPPEIIFAEHLDQALLVARDAEHRYRRMGISLDEFRQACRIKLWWCSKRYPLDDSFWPKTKRALWWECIGLVRRALKHRARLERLSQIQGVRTVTPCLEHVPGLRGALGGLSVEDQYILWLRFWRDLEWRDVGRVLGRNAQTVTSHFHVKIRPRLRRVLRRGRKA